MRHVLLTNDDGYQAEGLRALAEELADVVTLSIVAPSREQSGTAQSLTLRQPIVCNRIAEREWAIDGTPADCVIGALHHIPSMAVSLCAKRENAEFENSARVARATAEMIFKEGLPDQVLLNVNVPEPWNGSVQFTRQSKKITRNQLSEGKDPRGRSYFWLFEQRIERDVEPDTDYAAIFSSAVSITPLHLDPTHTESLNHLSHWAKTIAAAFPKQR